MRRWLAVFLLILLPLQLSWAVAAAYCGHDGQVEGAVITGSDGGAMPPHVGHHEHRHEPPAGASARSGGGVNHGPSWPTATHGTPRIVSGFQPLPRTW